jgi:hypothetical protein
VVGANISVAGFVALPTAAALEATAVAVPRISASRGTWEVAMDWSSSLAVFLVAAGVTALLLLSFQD